MWQLSVSCPSFPPCCFLPGFWSRFQKGRGTLNEWLIIQKYTTDTNTSECWVKSCLLQKSVHISFCDVNTEKNMNRGAKVPCMVLKFLINGLWLQIHTHLQVVMTLWHLFSVLKQQIEDIQLKTREVKYPYISLCIIYFHFVTMVGSPHDFRLKR